MYKGDRGPEFRRELIEPGKEQVTVYVWRESALMYSESGYPYTQFQQHVIDQWEEPEQPDDVPLAESMARMMKTFEERQRGK